MITVDISANQHYLFTILSDNAATQDVSISVDPDRNVMTIRQYVGPSKDDVKQEIHLTPKMATVLKAVLIAALDPEEWK